jgi:L-seryl-tRNA(Ser) seleniumtransferase
MTKQDNLKSLPSISHLLEIPYTQELICLFGKRLVTLLIREVLESVRSEIRDEKPRSLPEDLEAHVLESIKNTLSLFNTNGRKVINATGIILHTGLGRAPLSAEAIESLSQLNSYSLLEVDDATGERGTREREVELLLRALVECEAATVVNNNAAATFMALRAIATKKEVIISRGQLIEIGGSYRLPEVMTLSGCKLREVGTTNITRVEDYEAAITARTGAILHVHTSNYRIQGFHSMPGLKELRQVADKFQLPLIEDLGSGALVELSQFGLNDEQLVSRSLADGADIVCFSGDKLVGGPQAGIICGKRELVGKIRKNQFYRMFRPEKLTLLALETTLLAFSRSDYREKLPIYHFLARPLDDLRKMAETISGRVKSKPDVELQIVDTDSFLGGGTLPEDRQPSVAIKISKGSAKTSSWATRLAQKFRMGSPRVFGRIEKGSLYLDLKTVKHEEAASLVELLDRYL